MKPSEVIEETGWIQGDLAIMVDDDGSCVPVVFSAETSPKIFEIKGCCAVGAIRIAAVDYVEATSMHYTSECRFTSGTTTVNVQKLKLSEPSRRSIFDNPQKSVRNRRDT